MAITFTNDSATISTGEYSLPADTTSGVPTSQTGDGKYQFFIDLANLASGDQFQIRLYEKYDSGGTQRLVEEWIRTNAQARPMFVFPPDGAMVLGEGWDVTVKKLAGTDRSIAWSIRNSVDTGVADIQSRLPAALTTDGNIKADALRLGGTTQTGRDIGASVLLSSGSGTGQLDFTSGVVKANLAQILGTALTETSGLIAAGFKKFFNVATPTGTVNSLPDAVAGASGGLFIAGSNAATTANITGNITGNLSGSVGSVASGGITAASIAADAIGASELAADAVTEIQSGLATALALAAAQTSLDGIAAKTTNLPTDPADASDIAGLIGAINTLVSALPSAATIASTVWAAASRTLTAFGFSVAVSDKTGFSLSAAGVQAIWDALTSALTTVGSIGKLLVDNVNATISSRLASASYTAPPSAASIVAALMSEALTVGKTFEEYMEDIWAVVVGNAVADDATDPTEITYADPAGDVLRTHTLTSTTRETD